MKQETEQKIKAILGDGFVEDLKTKISEIESAIPTTKDNYGKYLAILSGSGKNKGTIASLLVLLGANKLGVIEALKLLN